MPNRVSFQIVAATTSILALFPGVRAIAGQATAAPPGQAVTAAPSHAERDALIDALVAKWGAHVQFAFGVDVEVWRDRLTARLANADATNLRDALRRDTYDGAMATLLGRGERVTDAPGLSGASLSPPVSDNLLGAVASDLVYTPVQPCRIVDTRTTAAGPIAQNASRSFEAINVASFAS